MAINAHCKCFYQNAHEHLGDLLRSAAFGYQFPKHGAQSNNNNERAKCIANAFLYRCGKFGKWYAQRIAG